MSDPGLEREDAAYLDALEAALRALCAVVPLWYEQDHTQLCCYCGAYRIAATRAAAAGAFPHEPDCPWLKAKALLGPEPQEGVG